MFFSDPVDRSSFFEKFLLRISNNDRTKKVGQLINRKDALKTWKEIDKIDNMIDGPAMISGPTISVTCLSKGAIIFSVILNIVTQTVFLASPVGVFSLRLPNYSDDRILEKINLEFIMKHGKEIIFKASKKTCKKPDDMKRFVTFLGKKGYKENFEDSMIFLNEPYKHLHYNKPGGPSRVLYLSEFQAGYGPIGFIMYNGEKITEWIHSLAFVKYAKNNEGEPALKIFEITTEQPLTKDSILMAPPAPYSVFRHKKGDDKYLNISRLRDFDKPSHFRSMLVVVPYDNEKIISIMRQNEYHEVSDNF